MKNVVMILTALALATPLAATAAGGREAAGKDLCLLHAENCPEQTDTIHEKLAKLQHEIDKGVIVYTPVEIARLERKLEEYQGLVGSLLSGGE
jgi:hypothetical protein